MIKSRLFVSLHIPSHCFPCLSIFLGLHPPPPGGPRLLPGLQISSFGGLESTSACSVVPELLRPLNYPGIELLSKMRILKLTSHPFQNSASNSTSNFRLLVYCCSSCSRSRVQLCSYISLKLLASRCGLHA